MKKFLKVAVSVTLALASVFCLTACTKNISASDYYKAGRDAYASYCYNYDIKTRSDMTVKRTYNYSRNEEVVLNCKENASADIKEAIYNDTRDTEKTQILKKTGSGDDISASYEINYKRTDVSHDVNNEDILVITTTVQEYKKSWNLFKDGDNWVATYSYVKTVKNNGYEDESEAVNQKLYKVYNNSYDFNNQVIALLDEVDILYKEAALSEFESDIEDADVETTFYSESGNLTREVYAFRNLLNSEFGYEELTAITAFKDNKLSKASFEYENNYIEDDLKTVITKNQNFEFDYSEITVSTVDYTDYTAAVLYDYDALYEYLNF